MRSVPQSEVPQSPFLWSRGTAARETLRYLDRDGIAAEALLSKAQLSRGQLSQDAVNLPQPRVPRVREGHVRRREVTIRRPIQRSNDGQRDKLGKLPQRLVVPADWAHRQ